LDEPSSADLLFDDPQAVGLVGHVRKEGRRFEGRLMASPVVARPGKPVTTLIIPWYV
jgi:hypothetical protein